MMLPSAFSRRPRRLPAVLTARAASLVAAAALLLVVCTASAQMQTREVPALSDRVYKQLSKAQAMLGTTSEPANSAGAAPSKDIEGAISLLNSILQMPNINGYEQGQAWNLMAYAHYARGDTNASIFAYEQVLSHRGAIPQALQSAALRTLAQLQFLQEDWQAAHQHLEQLKALNGKLGSSLQMLEVHLLRNLGREDQALALLIAMPASERGDNWQKTHQVLTADQTAESPHRNSRNSAIEHPVFEVTSEGLVLKTSQIAGFTEAGIAEGTVIKGIQFKKLTSTADLLQHKLVPGAPTTMEVVRRGKPLFVMVRLTQADVDLIQTAVKSDQVADVMEQDAFELEAEGEYLPIVKIQPQYPRRALSRGLQGWATVSFTVTETGSVANPVVVANCAWAKPSSAGECINSPNAIFDQAAVRAVLKFKYKPRVVNGKAIPTPGVQNKVTFELAE